MENCLGCCWVPLSAKSGKKKKKNRAVDSHYKLGWRTYLELSQVLVEMGMERDELPQFIFHIDE